MFSQLKHLLFIFLLSLALGVANPIQGQISPLEVDSSLTHPAFQDYFYFATKRDTEENKFQVWQIQFSPPVVTGIIKGNFEVPEFENIKQAKITVVNVTNDELVGEYNTNQNTGNYLIVIVPGIKYEFIVEVPGFGTHASIVEIPLLSNLKVSRQKIIINTEGSVPDMELKNTFFEAEGHPVEIPFSDEDAFDMDELPEDELSELDKRFSSKVEYEEDEEEIEAQEKKVKEHEIDKRHIDSASVNFSFIDNLVKKEVEKEKRKPLDAKEAFEIGDYRTAAILYRQLLELDPFDEMLNYYYGVSLFHFHHNKHRCLRPLEIASKNYSKEIPADVHYYLGRAYHLNYNFSGAIEAFQKFEKKGKRRDLKRYPVERWIEICENGNRLMSDQVNMVVEERENVNAAIFTENYDQRLLQGKVFATNVDIRSKLDEKLGGDFMVYKINSQEFFYSSYGNDEENGLDIYYRKKLPNGDWALPQRLDFINTPYDENYPYLSKDKKTLYFCSKGRNSMGGYDIFKAEWDEEKETWGNPTNMGYPINSPFDDILFVPDNDDEYAYMTSLRKSIPGEVEVMKIKIPKEPLDISVIKGNFEVFNNPEARRAEITVIDMRNDEIVGIYNSNQETGNYLLALPSGVKYEFIVYIEEVGEFSAFVHVPEQTKEFLMRQQIKLTESDAGDDLRFYNFFSEDDAISESLRLEKHKEEFSKRKQAKEKDKQAKEKKEETADLAKFKKEGLKLIKKGEYAEGVTQLQQYLRQNPDDAETHLECALAMIQVKQYNEEALPHFEKAYDAGILKKNHFFVLGDLYHKNYRFAKALNMLQYYKHKASEKEVEEREVDDLIQRAKNGMLMVNNPVRINIMRVKNFESHRLHFGFSDAISGKFLPVPEDMRSKMDEKNDYQGMLFLSSDRSTIYYSSYGEYGNTGKDIYKMVKFANGDWSLPQRLGGNINTPFDEEYVTVSPDGKTLYFSSKGHDSMGGYDIFMAKWNEDRNEWNKPLNLGSPVNSPFDDIYFIY